MKEKRGREELVGDRVNEVDTEKERKRERERTLLLPIVPFCVTSSLYTKIYI